MTKICCISDTHGMHREIIIPKCDLILHAGDLSNIGEFDQLEDFNSWVKELGIPTICIPGNHDKTIPRYQDARDIFTNCELLIDSSTEFNGLKIYGSPWTPWFHGHYWVYNAHRGQSIRGIWNKIPKNTDILITHGPPYEILDSVERVPAGQGCMDLRDIIKEINPLIHVFGHLHANHGTMKMANLRTTFVNASVCTEEYKPINPPIVVDI